MNNGVLFRTRKYNGKYVALKSFNENTVVASGLDPKAVISRANKKGITEPVIVYVPQENEIHVF